MNKAAVQTVDQSEQIDYMELDSIIEKEFNSDKENLIMMLQAIQKRYNYLPQPALAYLAAKITVPYSKIYGVATFYSTFSLEPRGRNIVSVCLGTACHVRGATRILDSVEEATGIKPGETDLDLKFSVETVNCLGCCALGPVVEVNGKVHGKMTPVKTSEALKLYE